MVKAQDILVLLKLVAMGRQDWSYNKLAISLGMSPSEVHAAVKRSITASLVTQKKHKIILNISNLGEFTIHGLKYVCVPERGALVRGMVTAYAAEPLKSYIIPDNEPPPVWPDPDGDVRGMAFSPLYKSAPEAARVDARLYELLVLVDGIRGEREVAIKELKKRMKHYDSNPKS